MQVIVSHHKQILLTRLHSELPKLYTILAYLSAIELTYKQDMSSKILFAAGDISKQECSYMYL